MKSSDEIAQATTEVDDVKYQNMNTTPKSVADKSGAAYHIPRRLHFIDREGKTRFVNETDLLSFDGPKIVLGEPGMGKSQLLVQFADQLEVNTVSAVRFMLHKNPTKLVTAGKPLLIDGLDEAMARRDGDAVDMILSQLEEAGSPDFILSCRAREWQARNAANLRQIYSVDPLVFSLEPLMRPEAYIFLARQNAKTDPERVLTHLDNYGLSELYNNPLTLGLMGRVAEHDERLPSTRAALFDRVCKLVWPEHDEDRQDSGLSELTEEQALSAAGAIAAGLLLSGSVAVSLAGAAHVEDGDIRLADIEALPGAQAARAVFSSKLYRSVGSGRAAPIHRIVAEFLGARWLTAQARSPRTQRRVLKQFHGSGSAPASLRGLHAWLAYHSPSMAEAVIHADPYGVIRYGEVTALSSDQAEALFDALEDLARRDPYFRAQDWGRSASAGLAVPALRSKISDTIASPDSNSHLRGLLIQSIGNTSLAAELTDTLETVVNSTKHSFSERDDALKALIPHRDLAWHRQAVVNLLDQITEDSARLALTLIEAIDCNVDDELLIATLLRAIGVTLCPLPRLRRQSTLPYHSYAYVVDKLAPARLRNVLELLCEFCPGVDAKSTKAAHDMADLASALIARALEAEVISTEDAAALWRWLGVLAYAGQISQRATEGLRACLDARDDLRRAVQRYALYEIQPRHTIFRANFDLARRLVGLHGHPHDIAYHLDQLDGADNRQQTLRQDWKDLVQLGTDTNGIAAEVLAASKKFQADDQQLAAFLHSQQNPKKPAWKIKSERHEAKRARKKRVADEFSRRHFRQHNGALKAGEFSAIVVPSQGYLGILEDVGTGKLPSERLVDWLGAELASDAIEGFKSVLFRSDLPTSQQVAASFAEDKNWNYCYAIMAGLLAKYRAGEDLTEVPEDVRRTGLLLCLEQHGMCNDGDVPSLSDAIDSSLFATTEDRVQFVRMWIEPLLTARKSHILALDRLAREPAWQTAGGLLAGEWLSTFRELPSDAESALIDCLTSAGNLDALNTVAKERAKVANQESDRQFMWLAVDLLVRFDEAQVELSGIGARSPEFIWSVRDRFQREYKGAIIQTTAAQAQWIIAEFRTQWPYAVLVGSGSGNRNSYDATDFLRAIISRLANDTCPAAQHAMQQLMLAPQDTYSDLIRHMAAEQRQKQAEEKFAPLSTAALGGMLTEGAPANSDDLKALVLEELAVAQKILIGDDVDQVRDFWDDEGIPYNENRCRDRLAAMIGPSLMRYNVQRITEADMPKTKRADLAFAFSQLQLPMEVKGQWHAEVWQAATDQLDRDYLIDWRSGGRGIYCVLWFGELPSKSGRRLQVPPSGTASPKSATEMQNMLVDTIPEARRALIDVVVLDLTAGKRSKS